MAFGLIFPLRIAQAVMAFLVLALSAYVAHWYNEDTLTNSPSQINFLIFVSLFSAISVAYLELVPRMFSKLSHPFAHLAFELLNALFYFAGFIALAVFLSKLLFCRGNVCSAARADAAFAAFGSLLWTGSTTLLALEIFRGGARGARLDKQMMKEAPNGLGA